MIVRVHYTGIWCRVITSAAIANYLIAGSSSWISELSALYVRDRFSNNILSNLGTSNYVQLVPLYP